MRYPAASGVFLLAAALALPAPAQDGGTPVPAAPAAPSFRLSSTETQTTAGVTTGVTVHRVFRSRTLPSDAKSTSRLEITLTRVHGKLTGPYGDRAFDTADEDLSRGIPRNAARWMSMVGHPLALNFDERGRLVGVSGLTERAISFGLTEKACVSDFEALFLPAPPADQKPGSSWTWSRDVLAGGVSARLDIEIPSTAIRETQTPVDVDSTGSLVGEAVRSSRCRLVVADWRRGDLPRRLEFHCEASIEIPRRSGEGKVPSAVTADVEFVGIE